MKHLRNFVTTTAALVTSPSSSSLSTVSSSLSNNDLRSNSTHLIWHNENDTSGIHDTTMTIQKIQDAKKESYEYLRKHIMNFDLPFLQTLGFHDHDNETDPADGLADGLVGPAIDLAIQAKVQFEYTDRLPKAIWQEYVLNYANLNEARSDIRQLLWDRLVTPLLLKNPTRQESSKRSLTETIQILNTKMWTLLAPKHVDCIVFESGQTPQIFDPMSVLGFGHASCTGLAILFVQALRAAGIPARVAGTAAWHGEVTQGNHNWVEVYVGPQQQHRRRDSIDNEDSPCEGCQQNYADCDCGWSFMEPSPAQKTVDNVDRDPCSRWFCNPTQMNHTQFYASRLSMNDNGTFFPLAWELENQDVPATNRTLYYQSVCGKCGTTTLQE